MGHMNILFPKLLGQTLRQGSQAKLPSCKCAGSDVASQTRRSACKNQRSSGPICRINLVFLEGLDCISGKGESSLDVNLQGFSDLFRGDIKERFPDSMSSVPYRSCDDVFVTCENASDLLPCRLELLI